MNKAVLQMVIPCFNEAKTLPLLMQRLLPILDKLPITSRVLLVDDGSKDETIEVIRHYMELDSRLGLLVLSRNFGKELALTAGLDACDADAVVVMDADLQDPPELITEFLEKFQQGYDVVYGVRSSREGESWLKRATAAAFYRTISKMSDTPIPRDTGDFRLLSRRAVNALRTLRERHRFMKGLFAWVGFKQIGLPYKRELRAAGNSSFNYWKLWNFALEGITAFSTLPLRLATYAGLITALGAFAYGAWIILQTFFDGSSVPGYPSLMVVILFLGGVQLMALGTLGEYLGRMYGESKQRPLYLVDSLQQPWSDHGAAAAIQVDAVGEKSHG